MRWLINQNQITCTLLLRSRGEVLLSITVYVTVLTRSYKMLALVAIVTSFGLASTSPVQPFSSHIYVAANDGYLHSINFWENESGYSLSHEGRSDGCATNPTWLTLNPEDGRVWCLDEGLGAGRGTINAFSVSDHGALAHYDRHNVSAGPVHGILVNQGRAMAVSYYGGETPTQGGISIFNVTGNGTIACGQTVLFEPPVPPGPMAPQNVARAHGALLDRSGRFLVVLDLGADLVKLFSVDQGINTIKFLRQYQMRPGSGPRHAVFWYPLASTNETTHMYLYVVSEFTSDITIFRAFYTADTLLLSDTGQTMPTVGLNSTLAIRERTRAAEIAVAPDNRFLIVSNRNDSLFESPPSDSLATFEPSAYDGALTLRQLAPVGGSFPRHFALSSSGHRILVSLQKDSCIVILDRDVESGIVGETIARLDINTTAPDGTVAGINAAIWGPEQDTEGWNSSAV